ncbi:MAG: AMP-binding protein [Pseudomonadales bacterium]
MKLKGSLLENEPTVSVQKLASGSLLLRSPIEMPVLPKTLSMSFEHWCSQYSDRVVIAEKNEGGQYLGLTYEEGYNKALAFAAQLIQLGGSQDTPLIILSGASRAHFVVAWGAILAGVAYVPVSTNYARVPAAYNKLRAVFDRTQPAFVWSENYDVERAALELTGLIRRDLQWLGSDETLGALPLSKTLEPGEASLVQERMASLDVDSVARYMFTSGSTGSPKGVIHTHGMISTFLASRTALNEDRLESEPQRVLDWMPWSHVGAGVLRMASVMNVGGSIYIDDGKPTPDAFHKTLANLKVVKPTSYAGAPLGWNMLIDALEQDDDLAESFFAHVTSFAYGSAAMPESTYQRLQALMTTYKGAPQSMSTSLMSTEVAVGLSRYWPCEDQTVVGLPMPGAEFKLLPVGDRFEIRVKSAGVSPGYINDPDRTAEAFDDEGFFKMGDAVTFADPDRPEAGLRFAGRIAEQFKLSSGTWVSAGTLRAKLIACCAPWVRDVVICGINEAFIAVLIWPNLARCAELTNGDEQAVAMSDDVRSLIAEGLRQHNLENQGSSQQVRRFMLLEEPPSIGEGEITEKGYVNQGLVQRRRSDAVQKLFSEDDISVTKL